MKKSIESACNNFNHLPSFVKQIFFNRVRIAAVLVVILLLGFAAASYAVDPGTCDEQYTGDSGYSSTCYDITYTIFCDTVRPYEDFTERGISVGDSGANFSITAGGSCMGWGALADWYWIHGTGSGGQRINIFPGETMQQHCDCSAVCEYELIDLEVACGSSDNVSFFDDELCEGYCVSCDSLADTCQSDCFDNVGYFACTATLGDLTDYTQVPVSLSIEDCVCNTDDCDDYVTACAGACGGIPNIDTFSCTDGVVTDACVCGDLYTKNYGDEDWTVGAVRGSGDDNTTPAPVAGTNDENTENIAQNTEVVSDNSGEIADNTKATADNTDQIGKVLDEELTNLNNTLSNIEKKMPSAEWPTDTEIGDMMDAFDNEGSILVSDYISDSTGGISDEIDLDQIPTDSLSGVFETVTGLVPVYTEACTPIDITFTAMGTERNLVLGCEVADRIKAIMGFLMALGTIWIIIGIVYSELRPQPKPV